MNPTLIATLIVETQQAQLEGEYISCHGKQTITVPRIQYENWRAGELIQNAIPQLNADDREFLISGMCGKCFDNLFKDGEE